VKQPQYFAVEIILLRSTISNINAVHVCVTHCFLWQHEYVQSIDKSINHSINHSIFHSFIQ